MSEEQDFLMRMLHEKRTLFLTVTEGKVCVKTNVRSLDMVLGKTRKRVCHILKLVASLLI
jgi:hypothetical protein